MTAIKTKRYSMYGVTSVLYDDNGETKIGKPLIFDFGAAKVYNNFTWVASEIQDDPHPYRPAWYDSDMPNVNGDSVLGDSPFNRVKVVSNCPYPYAIQTDSMHLSGHWSVLGDDDPRIIYGVQSSVTLLPPKGYLEYGNTLTEPTNPAPSVVAAFQAANAQLYVPYVFGVTIYRDIDEREIALSDNRKVDLSIIQAGGY
jgi:hypothetical protein